MNVGSSSVKLRVLGDDEALVFDRTLRAPGGVFDPDALRSAVGEVAEQPEAVGHRVVHGGLRFDAPVRIDRQVLDELGALGDLAPQHQRPALRGIEVLGSLLPGVAQVACFDTAFHASLPAAASTYPLPAAWRTRYGLRRFGFHGLSHAYASSRAAVLIGEPPARLATLSCHLGAGASLCAVRGGRSVDTTMGFTPLEGLMMATRAGSVDPGLITWLVGRAGVAVEEVEDALEHRSGLLALAGTPDMERVLAAAGQGEEPARLALEVYVHRLRAGVGAMAVALGRLDAVVFTGGVGEHAPTLRAAAADALAPYGVRVDPERNADAELDAEIGVPGARARVFVVRAREDLEIAREVRALLAAR